MMFFTPGISFTPRCTAWETILLVTLTVTLPMPGRVFSLPETCCWMDAMMVLAG